MRHISLLTSALAGLMVAAGALGGCGDDDLQFGDGGSSSAAGVGGSGGGQVIPPLDPAPAGMRRLLGRQYRNTIRIVFGDAAAAAAAPPDDLALHGFNSIGAAEIATPEAAIETYETSARLVGEAFLADQAKLAELLTCTPEGAAARDCFASFVGDVGRVAWRRSLTPAEIDEIVDIAVDAATEYGDPNQGILYAVMGLLQAPEFLYIVEVGEPDPEDSSRNRLTPNELVTRIAYFLTDSPPTRAMLDAAEAGAYETEDDLRELARELLGRPEAKQALSAFFAELYRLDEIRNVAKDETLFPEWSPEVAQAMYDSTQAMLADIVWTRNADAREFFSADYAFVNQALAPIYGVSVDTVALQKVTMPESQHRRGLMGQPSMMSVLASAEGTSPTRRGVFIQRVLMCNTIPPPDPNAELELPENDPDEPKTKKQLLEQHFEDQACAVCHQLFDPVGLAFESFDGLGRHRTQDENGLNIDPSGEQTGLGSFDHPGDVGQLLADQASVAECLVTNVFRHSMGHLETEGEEGALIQLGRSFADGSYSFQSLMVELVAHPAFRLVGDPK